MNRREVVMEALEFRPPPYVPWAYGLTLQSQERMRGHFGPGRDLEALVGSHFWNLTPTIWDFEQMGENLYRDTYGVIWDRSVDKDIGTPIESPLKRPEDLEGFDWPDPALDRWYDHIPGELARRGDLFTRFRISFTLYERAWSMRGMTELLMDMIERPEFVERLLDKIVEHTLVQIRRGLTYGVDAFYFGDDYGMQTGLVMGLERWRHFFKPRLRRLFAPVREAGKYVFLHSCGRVDSLFDDLIEVGLSCFNPFQPEVMDVFALKKRYHGRLAFHGGMSIQKTLPFGSTDEVRRATRALIAAGRPGGYVFSPSHGVPYDVPPENLVAMMADLRAQPGSPQE